MQFTPLRESIRAAVAVIAIVLSAASLRAQGTVPLTLQEAVRLALARNTDIRRAANAVAVAQSTVLQNQGNFLPTLNNYGGSRLTERPKMTVKKLTLLTVGAAVA